MKVLSRYKRFLIKSDDHFDEMNYPQLEDHLEIIKTGMAHLPEDFRSETLISFAKDGSLKDEGKESNPSLTEFINSNGPTIEYLEQLFDSCSENAMFRQELEMYIRKMLG